MSDGAEGAAAREAEEAAAASSFSSFVWDEASHLYFHARSGFYHDPHAGWYYSSRDGIYYRFEDGNYVPLDRPPDFDDSTQRSIGTSEGPADAVGDKEAYDVAEGLEDHRPPSEWLEDTLINIYLRGHSEPRFVEDDERSGGLQHGGGSDGGFQPHADMEENQQVSYDKQPFNSDCINEEHWKAQFGQVVKPENDDAPNLPVIDLWDWSTVTEKENKQEVRLLGRIHRLSKKLHPSLPAVGHLKTAKICEVHLDLVRVATGKIYRLRNPSSGYLASLPEYDASDPTRKWTFPSLDLRSLGKAASNDLWYKCLSASHPGILSESDKAKNPGYRDRAAERRALHGVYGIGLGEKRQRYSEELEETHVFSEMEAITMSCGPGSYSRRIMEGMGWKEGEALGRTKGGLLEPLRVIGNRGGVGLGWNSPLSLERPDFS